MAGSRALRKIQLGKETTAGTNVDATTIWRGMGTIKDNREVIFPEEDVGILGGTTRSYIARQWSEISMPSVESTFEQLPYIFEAGVQSVAAAQLDTGGSGTPPIHTPSRAVTTSRPKNSTTASSRVSTCQEMGREP
jgi:hypothetical protein